MVDTTSTFHKDINPQDYPYLSKYTHPVKRATRDIIGRDKQMREIQAAFERPELSNVILLAEGGGGKTALVQGLMVKDKKRIYLEVQLSKMIADAGTTPDQIAEWLRSMFNEAANYGKVNNHEVVLFIDEFHQIVQLSAAAVEVLKPLLADSGTRGIRVIAATTFEEFQKYVSPNQPLVERLQRIQLPQPPKEVIIQILRGMANKYGVGDLFPNNHLFELIYEYTNRYIPSQIQPRKSILVLDAMIGYHRALKAPMGKALLAQVLYDQQGINITFNADANLIEDTLNKHVLQQDIATSAIAHRLQICIADLNDKTKPMASFLFTGSTGVGKTEMAKQMTMLLFNDSQQLIRFDMSEFANEDSLDRFRDELTAQVWAHPYCILLLDEIEKSCAPVTRLLLSVLDDGRLSDRNNRTVSFINTYIIMTTNAASEIYKTIQQYQSESEDKKEFLAHYEDLIQQSIKETTGANRFPPELLGRIDTIVPFKPLSAKTMREITQNKLKALANEVRIKHDVSCTISKLVIEYLVGDVINTVDSDSGGARSVMHKLETEVTTNVAEFINTYPQVKNIYVKVDGQMMSQNKHELKSKAYIKVYAIEPK